MANVKLTYRSNGKKRKEWFAKCEGNKEGVFITATYSPFYEVWGFEAYTYKILKEGGAKKIDFCLVNVDGVAIDDIKLKVSLDDRDSVLAMAQKVATAVYEKSVYFNKKTA
jgi:hypothetical protein